MIIGIAGYKQSGKNTVADIWRIIQSYGMYNDTISVSSAKRILLTSKPPSKWEVHSFADKLKQIISVLTECNISDLENGEFKCSEVPEFWKKSMHIKTYRELLQKLGTDIFRNHVDTNVWIYTCLQNYDPDKDNWIVPDVRFINEAEAIKEKGGLLIRVIRGESKDTHISENDLNNYTDFDYTINNIGSLSELIMTVLSIYREEIRVGRIKE